MIKEIFPSEIKGEVYAPASKSYAQRAVAVSALAHGESILRNIDSCNDIDAAVSVVRNLGASVEIKGRECVVYGGPIHAEGAVLNIGESGLATRLFTPVAALMNVPVTVTGTGSILKRPVGMMEEPLRALGVKISSNKGFLPIELQGKIKGGELTIDGSLSSQFLTGLLITLPLAETDSVIHVKGLRSRPYIDMTIEVLRAFGVRVENENYESFYIKGNQHYRPQCYNVEGDWSGASCLLVAGAIAGEVSVCNLNPHSLQADKAILHALDYAGAGLSLEWDKVTISKAPLVGFSFDATDCPDLFPALIALAVNCSGQTVLMGTNRLKHKESDRAHALTAIYKAMGAEIDNSYENVMVIRGGGLKGGVTVDSFNDHRIAMSAAVAALTSENPVSVTRAECVNKSYCRFWDDLEKIQCK